MSGIMEDLNFNLAEIKDDLLRGISDCNKRGLVHSMKWLAELNSSITIPHYEAPADFLTQGLKNIAPEELDNYFLAKTYFDCKEYDRAAFFTNACTSPVPRFLNLYSMYMAKEKKRLDNTPDNTMTGNANLKDLTELMSILNEEYNQKKLDGYGLYLYGVVLKKLDLTPTAIAVFLEAVHLVPTLWSAWIEMAPLIQDAEHLRSLSLPKHWIKEFFIAHTYIEIFVNETGINLFEEIQQNGFDKSIYVTSQIAIAYHNKRDVDKAIEIFQQIQAQDPYRLENLDIYSNLLFVREEKMKMAHLANRAVEINKYRPETCCVIGNYYSIRGEHQKAILYFQRALKLNPKYLSAWTLMGHEFMELKNTNAAIQSYRQAVEVNRRDFRAWYGLGQAYEIIKMPFYGLYYYKIATQLRPYDSRMLNALGETYEKLGKTSNAIKCYQKAHNVGDIEGYSMLKLGSLYVKLNERDKAADAYLQFVSDERSSNDKNSRISPYIYLANYNIDKKCYDEAELYAQKVLEYQETNQEAKGILKTIAGHRARPEDREEDLKNTSMELEPDEVELLLEGNTGGELDMEITLE